ncbi:MAG: deoxyribodipyrimidine photo-lyase, partial [Jannaschia sp.]
MKPILYWTRRDFRLGDNPALTWAAEQERPVIPVFLLDEVVEGWGAAPRWRLGLGLEAFAQTLEGVGSRLILRRGPALETLRGLVEETGADTVVWNRLYVAEERARDTGVKEGLRADGLRADSHAAHVLFEPWTVETGSGSHYKVFTPLWKAVRNRDPGPPAAPVAELAPPDAWPGGDDLA